MIGRGIFHNPFAFEKEPRDHSSEELLDLAHLDLHDQYSAQMRRSFSALVRFFKIYVRGFRGASELRNNLMNAKSTSEVRALMNLEARILMRQMNEEIKWTGWRNSGFGEQIILLENMADLAVFSFGQSQTSFLL